MLPIWLSFIVVEASLRQFLSHVGYLSAVTVRVGLLLSVQVRNLSIAYVDHTRLDLIWEAPDVSSDVTKTGILRYSVSCVTCSDNISFIPARSRLNATRFVSCNQ